MIIQKSQSTYRSSIRAAITGLWREQISRSDFQDAMIVAINRGYHQAAIEGAKVCGVSADEMTIEELRKVEELVNNEKQYIDNLADDIEAGNKASGGKIADLIYRADLWSNRYGEVRTIIQLMVCKDAKMKWIYGDTDHCNSCLDLNGRVYRASVWSKANVWPQGRMLECKGFRCKCRLEPTDDRVTSGRFPSLKSGKKKKR